MDTPKKSKNIRKSDANKNNDDIVLKKLKKEDKKDNVDCILINSVVGPLKITASDDKLLSVLPIKQEKDDSKAAITKIEETEKSMITNKILLQFRDEVDQYFRGQLKEFKTPYNQDHGTEFQRKVWNEIRSIPYGKTTSYTQIAIQLGLSTKYTRAIGGCCRSALFYILIPVHRVVSNSGKSVGKCGKLGINKQLVLLNIEKQS